MTNTSKVWKMKTMERKCQKHNMPMKKEIRRMTEPKARFTCEVCGKLVKNAGRFEHRHAQFISDHIPRLLTNVCRTCIYRESFGKKGINVRKRENQIEKESHLYVNVE